MDKKILAIDLETIANPAMMDFLPPVQAAGNLKDPAKIEADIDAKQKKQIAEMGLDPTLNLICCAGWHTKEGSNSIVLEDKSPEAEKKLLLSFWEAMIQYDVFVGYNSRAFDLRCLLLHGMEHGIRPSVNIDKSRYNRIGSNHVDLRPILAGEGQFAKGKLDFFCNKYLQTGKTEDIDGSRVQDYWDMGLSQDVAFYCENDAKLTYELYLKAEIAGLLE